jgi:hypothetical protein
MTDEPKPKHDPEPTKRARERNKAQQRRAQKVARREMILDLVVSGYEREAIARKFCIGLSTVCREVERALDQRRPDSHERYIRLRTARLTKALRAADDAIEQGDLKAIDPLVKVIGALDRYQGLVATTPTPTRLTREPAPLALTHFAPPLAMGENALQKCSEKGA